MICGKTVLQSFFSTLLQLDVRSQSLCGPWCASLHYSQQLVWRLRVDKSLACCALHFDCHRIAGPVCDCFRTCTFSLESCFLWCSVSLLARWQDISVHILRRFWRLLAVCTTGVVLLTLHNVQELMNLDDVARLASLMECFFLVVASTRNMSAPRWETLFFGTLLMRHHEYSRSHHHHQRTQDRHSNTKCSLKITKITASSKTIIFTWQMPPKISLFLARIT